MPKAGHYPSIEDNNTLPVLVMRRITTPERRGDCMRPSSLSGGSTAGWGSALSLVYLGWWNLTVVPLAEPVRGVFSILHGELAPRRYQSEKAVTRCFAQHAKLVR
eukprot:3357657-Pyramimonas_sp.AAC.1